MLRWVSIESTPIFDRLNVLRSSFIGAVFRKNGLVKLFLLLMSIILLLQIGVSIYALYCYYHTRGHPVDECVNGSQSPDTVAACNVLATFVRIPQGYVIASAIVPILVQACEYALSLRCSLLSAFHRCLLRRQQLL